MEDNNKLHYGLSLRLYFEEKAFGPGMVALLRAVEKTGSLQRAARSMNMAYSKAWRIVKHTEETFRIQLLERNGAHGSTLTDDGKGSLPASYNVANWTVCLKRIFRMNG